LPSPLAIATLTEVAIGKLEEDGGKAELVAELNALLVSTNARLDKHERLTCLVVSATPWTIDNNLITPTLKVKRTELEAVFKVRFPAWAASRKTIMFVD
jgi:long-chain acyl-CoA synthetase